jgi:hypothetical protein
MVALEILLQPVFGLGQRLAPWVVVGLISWRIWIIIHDTVTYAMNLHEIPCSRCQFFTNNHRLKCTIHPNTAMSEAAVGCPDFCLKNQNSS